MKKLKDYSEDIYKCSKCGLCQAVCPIFQETGLETSVSRGKFTLLNGILNGQVEFSPKIAKYLDMCLGCKACYDFCPSGISAEEIITAARHENACINGIGFIKKFIISNFKSNFRLKLLKIALNIYKKAGFIFIAELLAKLTGDLGKFITLFNTQVIQNINYKKLTPAKPQSDTKVVYFPGCINNYVNQSAKNAVIMVLEKNGFDVQSPKEFSCCGIAARSAGDYNSFVEMAKNNLDQIPDDVDYVITDCASCGSAWDFYPEYLEGELKQKAEKIAEKAININKFLTEIDLYIPEKTVFDKTVTYHDPCHLVRFQKISEEPRNILRKIPGLNFKEMEEADKCCGAAGTFCVVKPEISQAISTKKARNIINTNADIVSTSCSGCKIGIAQGLVDLKINKKILSPVEILAEIYIQEE